MKHAREKDRVFSPRAALYRPDDGAMRILLQRHDGTIEEGGLVACTAGQPLVSGRVYKSRGRAAAALRNERAKEYWERQDALIERLRDDPDFTLSRYNAARRSLFDEYSI